MTHLNPELIKAIVKRWWYLLTYGMWRGECGYQHYENGHLIGLTSGRPGKEWYTTTHIKIWWKVTAGTKLWHQRYKGDHPWRKQE